MINRPEYLKKLLIWKDKTDVIKVISGVRRCGKSTLFKLFQEKLAADGVPESQIININFERAEFAHLLDWTKMNAYIESLTRDNKTYYVFLDEVQMVPDFQNAVNSLRLQGNIDMYITGSNAYMYSQKIATLLAGRSIEIKMFPLSFLEFKSAFYDKQLSPDELFDLYRQFGGFPDVARTLAANNQTPTVPDDVLFMYFDSLYNTVVAKDISLRTGIASVSEITRIVKFLFSNLGNKTSFNNIMNVVNTEFNFTKTDKNVYVRKVQQIVDALKESFLFYQCDRQSLKGKELLRTETKYYAVDTGLRYFMLGGNKDIDGGHILENIVYLELLRRGYRVTSGKVDEMEVDFVAEKGDDTKYFQVSLSLDSEETFKREVKPLEMIPDNYEKTILVFNPSIQKSYKGIKIIKASDWLTTESE